MYKIVAMIIAVFPGQLLAGEFDFKVGMSLSMEAQARPEIDLPGPLGILRMQYKTDKGNELFCEHISSIPAVENGNGLNHCGFMVGL